MKVIIFAANGYIGQVLVRFYNEQHAEVIAVTRKPVVFPEGIRNVLWDGKEVSTSWAVHLENVDLLINLAGKSVNCRYTEENKKAIFDSRTDAIQAIEKAIHLCKQAPKLWINAASATIYRHAEDRPMDELTGEIGTGFSVEVCKKWESTFFEAKIPSVRRVALRMAIVLGNSEGVFLRLKNLIRFGLGGKQGNGKQMFSWIHEQDLCRMIEFIRQNESLEGIFNASAPLPVSNASLMKLLRKAMHIPFGLPAPVWLLKLGARMIGTETELILKSRWVVPARILESGFTFLYPAVPQAFEELAGAKD